MANQVEIRIQVDDGGSSTTTASRFDAALASMTEQQQVATAEMIKNTHELGIQTQVETELMKAKYLDMLEKVRASGMLTASELQAVNTKIAGIKIAGNMNELNDAMKITIPTTQKLAATEVTLAEATALLKTGFDSAARGSFQLSSEMGRMESMMIRMAIRGALMGVAIGGIVTAYKDANLVSEDMHKSSEQLHTSFIALREELAVGLAPAFEQLNIGASHALDGFSQFVAGWEASGTRLAQFSLRIGVVLQNPFGKVSDYKEKFAEIDRIAGEELDRIYANYEDKGKKLQAALNTRKGGAGGKTTPEAVDYGIEREAIAIQKEYQSMLDATMSAEDRKAAQLEQFHQRAIEIYGAEEAAVMTLAIRTAQAKEIERQANEKAAIEREKFSTAVYNSYVKEFSATKSIGDAIVAATKSMVAEVIKAMGQEEAMKAGRDIWDGFTLLANPLTAALAPGKFASGAGHAALAVAMGAASVAVSGGGGGGAAPSSVAQGGIASSANVQTQQETSHTIVIDSGGQEFLHRNTIDKIFDEINKAAKERGRRFDKVIFQ